ncbi:MAG TPA: ABC transporter substrate-binding protein [Streptosporangiaceae bacterium]|nr:ABC transporter substrate-binding protein [Streptosporangiaceae bacterium]
MRFPHIRRASLRGVAVITAVVVTAAGCGGSAENKSSADGLEKRTITVGLLPIADAAQLKVAIDRGFFKAEGLTVKTQMLQGGAEAPPKLQSGNLDLAIGAYVPFFMAKAAGFPLHIVADAFETAPGTHTVMVAKDSPIHTVKDLVGKKIAVNVKHNLATLLIQATLQPQGVKLDENKNFVAVPFPNMQAALKNRSVDAAQFVEPFGTQAQKSIGARLITDLSQGPTTSFPVGGYASTESWAKKNPKTAAAFQRAIYKAQAVLADRQVLAQTLPTYTQIDPATAATIHTGTYPTTINPTRLQRVADLMQQYRYLEQPLDVKALLS